MPRRKNSFSSELTYIILLILRHSLTPTRYISLLTGEPSKKVSKYLSFLKKKGLVRYENGFWTLTPQGERIADKLDSIFKFYSNIFYRANLNNYLKNDISKNKKTTKIQIYSNLFKNIPINSNLFQKIEISSSQVSSETTKIIDKILFHANRMSKKYLGRSLDDVERAILEFLIEYYTDTGRNYWMPEDSQPLAEGLASVLSRIKGSSISSIDVASALKSLQSAGILFLTYDERKRVPKLRISKGFLERVLGRKRAGKPT